MSVYGQHIESTLSKLCDFEYIEERVSNDINISYNYLLNGKFYNPLKTSKLLGFIKLYNQNVFNFTDTILKYKDSSNTVKIGYNGYKIQESVIGDTSILLDRVTNQDILKIIEYEKTIYNQFEQSYYYFQQMLNLYYDFNKSYLIRNRYFYDFIFDYDLKSPYEYVCDFRIFNKLDDIFLNKSCFIYVIIFSVINRVIRRLDLTSLINNYFDTLKYQLRDLITSQFETFIDANIDSFATDFYQYAINNNILIRFESDSFKDHVIDVFKTHLSSICIDNFANYINTIDLNTLGFAENIAYNYATNLAHYATNEEVYHRVDVDYFDIDLNYLLGFERYLYQLLSIKFRDEFKSNLEQLQYINIQWKLNPLFFINNQIFSHYSWIQYNETMGNSNVFYLPNISIKNDYDIMDYIFDKISISDSNSVLLESYICDLIDLSTFLYRDAFNVAFNDNFMQYISKFINSDIVETSLMTTFLPNVIKDINKDFYFELDSYKIIDSIKIFLSSYFYKHICDNVLFSTLRTDIYNNITSFLSVVSSRVSSGIIKKQLDIERLNSISYYGFFNRYFLSVKTSEYINDFLAQFKVDL